MRPTHSVAHMLLISVLALTLAACGSASRQLANALPTPTVATSQAQPTTASTIVPVSEATAEPTKAPEPTDIPATATPEPKALQLGVQGFGQSGRQVGYSFLVTNPNENGAVEDAQYQIAIFDKEGVVIETDSGTIALVMPGQTLGVGGNSILDEGQEATKIEVQIQKGDLVSSDKLPAFTVDKITDTPDSISNHITAEVTNPYTKEISNVRLSAVIYDNSNAIIGGGFTYISFIPANNSTGIELSYVSSEKPAKIELYPSISNLSNLTDEGDRPKNAQALNLKAKGLGQKDQQLGYGFLVENPNPGYAAESVPFRVVIYDDNNLVISASEGYLSVVLPQQTLGVGDTTYLPDGKKATSITVQIGNGGEYNTSEPLPPFTSENINFQDGGYSSSVTGSIVSPYAKDITNLRVSALAYDKSGAIIGGGFTFLDFVPANKKAAVEVSVVVAGKPANVELYGTLSGLSDFK